MRNFLDRLFEFWSDRLGQFPTAHHLLFGDALVPGRDALDLKFAQPSSVETNIVQASMKGLVAMRADRHWLCALRMELTHNRLTTDLLSVYV